MLLTKADRDVLVAGYERRMLQQTRGALLGLAGSLRRHLYRQAQRMAAYIENPWGQVDRAVMALTRVIAYDISDDSRRAHVAAILQAHGDRVQRSVFICTVEADVLHEVCGRVRQVINPRTDSVYVFGQCAPCCDAVGVYGQATVNDEPPYWAVL